MLFAPYYYDTVGPKIIPQAREAGYTGAIMGADGFDGTQDYAVGDLTAYENVFFTNHYSAEDPSELVQNFVKAYKAKFGTVPDAFAALNYDATNLLLEAVKKANSADPEAIRKAFEGLKDVQEVSGKITFDKQHNPIKPAVVLKVKADKTYEFVTTVNP
jgi:branched-chain amino acid transport system substrate-binding protein